MLAHSPLSLFDPCPRSPKICGTPYQIPPCAEIDNHPDAIHLISVPGDLRLEGKVQEGRAGRGLGRRSPAPIDLLFRDRLRYQFLEQASGLVSRTPYLYCLSFPFSSFYLWWPGGAEGSVSSGMPRMDVPTRNSSGPAVQHRIGMQQ